MSQPQLMLEYRQPLQLTLKPRYKHKRKWKSNSKAAKLEAEIEQLEKRAVMYQHLVNAWIKTRRLLVEDKFDDWKGSKSTLFSTYQDMYADDCSWSVGTEEKLENFVDKVCEESGLSSLRDVMLKMIQHLYKQEMVRYVEELHRYHGEL